MTANRAKAYSRSVRRSLQRMSNIDLVSMVPTANALLAAGATVTAQAREFVKCAAETFEFHRAGFTAESVAETSAASNALCALFEVEPPAARRMHDGGPIIAKAVTWQKQHAELWNLLVPSSGACATVQGEVIRIAGRMGDELYRNGGGNWDEHYDRMLAALCVHMGSHNALPDDQLAECETVAARVRDDERLVDRLTELAVIWVGRNSTPIALTKIAYKR